MSSPTWTLAKLSSELRSYERRDVWRLVDAQYRVSTRKLVDSLAEQEILEDLVDATKPPVPSECQGLDDLLSRPFRSAPYPKGSRFRRAGLTPGVYYAAEQPRTAAAEMAFYRLLFFAESPDTPWPANPLQCTGFSATVFSYRSLDLTKPPLDDDRSVWRHPVEYAACQELADAARKAGAEILRYESARDPAMGGVCVAVLSCTAFVAASPPPMHVFPRDYQTWRIGVSRSGAYVLREFPVARIEFDRNAFASDPRIAAMRWDRHRW
jgi:RES domain